MAKGSVSEIVFLSNSKRFGIRIEEKEIHEMLSVCQSSGNKEVGGVVIGNYSLNYQYALVKAISDAPVDSVKGLNNFERGIRGLQQLLDRYWRNQGYFYLGEWHFHPNSSAHASPIDIAQMTSISISDNYNCPEPILIILGGDPNREWEINAYVFPRNKTPIRCLLNDSSCHGTDDKG